MNHHTHIKWAFTLLFFSTITIVCNGQYSLDGRWYLQEVQIPSSEEFTDGIRYENYKCLIFSGENNEEVAVEWVDTVAVMESLGESYEETVASLEGNEKDMLDNDDLNGTTVDTVELDNAVRELYDLSEPVGILYEIFSDSILVLNPSYGIYDVYVIKKLTKDCLIIATDRTLHGYMMLVYGKTEQPIKHSKHNVVTSNNDGYSNPIVNRLGAKEIISNKTPSAVAYNFVNAILESNPNKMLSNMDFETANAFETSRQTDGYANYDPYFSEKGSKLNILGWKPYLSNGCEVAILHVQSEWFDNKGRAVKKVYVGCVPSAEIGHLGFQNITTFGDTNVKVLVVRDNDNWKVVGFK